MGVAQSPRFLTSTLVTLSLGWVSVRAILDRRDVQAFGSYVAIFHPHAHALVADGAFNKEGLRGLQWVPFCERCPEPA